MGVCLFVVVVAGGLGSHVVLTVGEKYLDRGHVFFYDNFFSSVGLAEELLRRRTRCCGTVRTNRKGWPKELDSKKTKKMKRGETKMLQKGELLATVWYDKKPISILSTAIPPTMGRKVRRVGGGKKKLLSIIRG